MWPLSGTHLLCGPDQAVAIRNYLLRGGEGGWVGPVRGCLVRFDCPLSQRVGQEFFWGGLASGLQGGSVSGPGARRASFLTRAPPVTFFWGAISAVHAQCNYLDV